MKLETTMYTLEVKRIQNRRSNMSFLEKEFSKRHVQEEEADGEEEESDDEEEESDDEDEESDDEEEESDDEAEETDDHGDDSNDDDNEDQDEDTTAPVTNSIAPTSNPGTIGTASELTVPLNTGQNGVQNSLRSGPAKVQTSVVVVTVIGMYWVPPSFLPEVFVLTICSYRCCSPSNYSILCSATCVEEKGRRAGSSTDRCTNRSLYPSE